jgi:hypothetical protein
MKRISTTVIALTIITIADLIITHEIGASMLLWIFYGLFKLSYVTDTDCDCSETEELADKYKAALEKIANADNEVTGWSDSGFRFRDIARKVILEDEDEE